MKIGVPKNTQSNSLTPILTITVERALLRLAPSDESSVVTTLDKGTKVTAEKRQGEWYQIISPDGVRAWVKATSVGQGSLNRSRTGEFLPQRDYSSNSMDTDESRALDLLRRR